jgi:hypothetical protein
MLDLQERIFLREIVRIAGDRKAVYCGSAGFTCGFAAFAVLLCVTVSAGFT